MPRDTPGPDGRTGIAMSINPDAGTHPVTADPRELDAARRATERSLARFPYYTARYGDRALRFGDSDGAWLALIAQLDPPFVLEQTGWLASVLASRGMPTLLMEEHLRYLSEELSAAVPEHADRYAQLRAAADALRERRHRGGDPARLAAIAAAFGERTGASGGMAGLGEILVAAAADENAGLSGTVHNVESWACDPARFGAEWIDAVRDTVAEAGKAGAAD
ncbi:MAG TPA: hypothetical protein VF665_15430 [Longimicrobium sp.]|jgi:hypothetical protein|uniref:hypothetical protein n=1 Tax=Longimicrobium sp. TaxID=2029185 RepID=UPI002ED94226